MGVWLVALATGCATIRKFNPIESHTLEARRLTQQAESAMHQQAWDEAESKLVTAVERCPEDNRARACLAEVLWQRGAHRAAVEQLSKSIDLAGRRDPLALTKLGQMELSLGNLAEALRHANEALARDNSLADAWTLKGFALKGLGRSQDALSAFYRSLSIRNHDPCTRLEIASIYRDTGQAHRALAILDEVKQQSTAACPHHPEICYLRGLLMQEVGRAGDAVVALREAQAQGCQAPDLPQHLAAAQMAAGQMAAGQAARAKITRWDASARGTPTHQVALQALEQRGDKILPPNQHDLTPSQQNHYDPELPYGASDDVF